MESLDSQKLSCKSQGCCSDSFGKCQMLFLSQDSSFGPSADLISCRYKVIFLQWFNDESVATFVLIGRIERSSFSLVC